MSYLKIAARYALVGIANALTLIARGSTWLANRLVNLEREIV